MQKRVGDFYYKGKKAKVFLILFAVLFMAIGSYFFVGILVNKGGNSHFIEKLTFDYNLIIVTQIVFAGLMVLSVISQKGFRIMGVFATIMVVCDMVSAIVAAVIWFNNGGGIITAPLIYVFFLRHFTEALIAAVLALQLSNKIPKSVH